MRNRYLDEEKKKSEKEFEERVALENQRRKNIREINYNKWENYAFEKEMIKII